MDDQINKLSAKIENSNEIKVVVYDKNILPIYLETKDLVFVVSKKLKMIFSISMIKCKIMNTNTGTLYYLVVPSPEDIELNKVPIRPFGCSKNLKKLDIDKLSENEYLTTFK